MDVEILSSGPGIDRVTLQQNNNNWIVDQWRKGIYCDVRVHATTSLEPAGADPGSQPIQAHKLFLANASPYFAKVFFGPEGPTGGEFVVNGMDRATLFYLIKYIYTKAMEPLNDGSALKILRGAKKLELDFVVRECKKFIRSLTEDDLLTDTDFPNSGDSGGSGRSPTSSRASYPSPDRVEQPGSSTPVSPLNSNQTNDLLVRTTRQGPSAKGTVKDSSRTVHSKRKGQRSDSTSMKKRAAFGTEIVLLTSSPALDRRSLLSRSIPATPTFPEKINPTIYFCCKGRGDKSGKIMSYSFQKRRLKELTTCSSLPRNCLIYHGGNIYDIGGRPEGKEVSSSQVKVFNVETKKWKKISNMIETRADHNCVVLNDSLYAIGGCNSSDAGINCVERLPTQMSGKRGPQWEEVDFMERSRAETGLCVCDGKIYAVGGYVAVSSGQGAGMKASRFVECYDPVKDQWTGRSRIRTERLGLAVAVVGSKLYAMGGGTCYKPPLKKLSTVEVYNFKDDSWDAHPVARMKRPRQFFSAVVIKNEIYVVGGDSDSKPTMEKYNVRTNQWTMVDVVLPPGGKYHSVAFNDGE